MSRGIELLERLAEEPQTLAVILVTAHGTIDSAVQAMRLGAYDYITKPIDHNRLPMILSKASALFGARAEFEAAGRRLHLDPDKEPQSKSRPHAR
jgi:DNA-binding NtrC family response regulator